MLVEPVRGLHSPEERGGGRVQGFLQCYDGERADEYQRGGLLYGFDAGLFDVFEAVFLRVVVDVGIYG